MKTLSIFSIFCIAGFLLANNTALAKVEDTTICLPISNAECVRVDVYVGSTKTSTHIYYGQKAAGSPGGPNA